MPAEVVRAFVAGTCLQMSLISPPFASRATIATKPSDSSVAVWRFCEPEASASGGNEDGRGRHPYEADMAWILARPVALRCC